MGLIEKITTNIGLISPVLMYHKSGKSPLVVCFGIVIILFGCSPSGKSQFNKDDCSNYYDSILNKEVYLYVTKRPEYPGGNTEFLKIFMKNFKFPDQEMFQGEVVLSFIVNTDGNLIDMGIYNKKLENYTAVDKEGLRVLKMSQKWGPGKCGQKNVPVRVYFPIKF